MWMHLMILGLCVSFFITTTANAEEDFNWIEFKLAGGEVANVAWKKEVVTYGYVRGTTDFPGNLPQENCGRMLAIDELFDRHPGLDRDRFDAAVRAGFALWDKILPRIRFKFTKSDDADILIGVQAQPWRVAFTDLRYDPDSPGRVKALSRGAICLNPELAWHTGPGGTKEEPGIPYTFAHEIGHVIGLDHSGNSMALMHFRFKEHAVLSPEDVRAAKELYEVLRGCVDLGRC